VFVRNVDGQGVLQKPVRWSKRPPKRKLQASPEAVYNYELGERIALFMVRSDQRAYRALEKLAEFDANRVGWSPAHRSCADWLAWRCGMAIKTAREHVRVARALKTLPVIANALANGQLSYSKVRAVTRVANERNEAQLHQAALTHTADSLDRLVSGLRRESHVEEALQDATRRQSRAAWFTTDRSTGMLRGGFHLAPESGSVLEMAMNQAMPARNGDTLAQRRADALERIARHFLERGDDKVNHSSSHMVVVTVDQRVMAESDNRAARVESSSRRRGAVAGGPAGVEATGRGQPAVAGGPAGVEGTGRGEPAVVGGPAGVEGSGRGEPAVAGGPAGVGSTPAGGASVGGSGVGRAPKPLSGTSRLANGVGISAATAQRLACGATIVQVERDASGQITAVGRRTRAIPRRILLALHDRDPLCRFPGCHETVVEPHHLVPFACGGEHDVNNLAMTCRAHHWACHEGGCRLQMNADLSFTAFDPNGYEIPESGPRAALQIQIEAAAAAVDAADAVAAAESGASQPTLESIEVVSVSAPIDIGTLSVPIDLGTLSAAIGTVPPAASIESEGAPDRIGIVSASEPIEIGARRESFEIGSAPTSGGAPITSAPTGGWRADDPKATKTPAGVDPPTDPPGQAPSTPGRPC
jgi:hypothetical protein